MADPHHLRIIQTDEIGFRLFDCTLMIIVQGVLF